MGTNNTLQAQGHTIIFIFIPQDLFIALVHPIQLNFENFKTTK